MHKLILVLGFLLAVTQTVLAANDMGTIKTSKGEARITRDGENLPAAVGSSLQVSDRIITGADGVVGITLKDNTRLTAGPNTTLDLKAFHFDTTTHAGDMNTHVEKGSLAVISGKIAKANPGKVRFSTPSVTLGVRGTKFIIEAGK